MIGHQAAHLDHLLEVVEQEQVDLVVVAGDIYDRALPTVDAVQLANDTFTRLARSRAQVVVTSGNHDSSQRLGFGSAMIDAAGVYIRTRADSVGTPVLLHDDHGPVAVYGLPYLDPDAMRSHWSLEVRSHEAALREAIRRVHVDLAIRGSRSVVLAHAFVAGAEPSDSERDISVGGVSMVPTSVFDGIDYVALGHLHGRHTLTESVRYSGSPLAYSFSEAAHVKGGWLVDLGPTGAVSCSFIEAPVPRQLARLRGTLDELLRDRSLTRHERSLVQVTLTDDVRPSQAMERLRRRFPHTLVLGFDPADPGTVAGGTTAIREKSDHEISLDFVAALRGSAATPEEAALLLQACDACCDDPDLDLAEVTAPTRVPV